MTLLVSGWLALDEIKTPFGEVEGSLGGSATFAVLAAALFTDVRLLAVIGNDFPEHELRFHPCVRSIRAGQVLEAISSLLPATARVQ